MRFIQKFDDLNLYSHMVDYFIEYQAVPLSNFITKCIKNWLSMPVKTMRAFYHSEQFHRWMPTKVISCEELGLALVGFLKVNNKKLNVPYFCNNGVYGYLGLL